MDIITPCKWLNISIPFPYKFKVGGIICKIKQLMFSMILFARDFSKKNQWSQKVRPFYIPSWFW